MEPSSYPEHRIPKHENGFPGRGSGPPPEKEEPSIIEGAGKFKSPGRKFRSPLAPNFTEAPGDQQLVPNKPIIDLKSTT
jgi:hypothetical protein